MFWVDTLRLTLNSLSFSTGQIIQSKRISNTENKRLSNCVGVFFPLEGDVEFDEMPF